MSRHKWSKGTIYDEHKWSPWTIYARTINAVTDHYGDNFNYTDPLLIIWMTMNVEQGILNVSILPTMISSQQENIWNHHLVVFKVTSSPVDLSSEEINQNSEKLKQESCKLFLIVCNLFRSSTCCTRL